MPPVGEQVLQRLARQVGTLVQARQIEMGIGKVWILCQCLPIRCRRFLLPIQVLEQNRKIEGQQRIARARLPIELLGLRKFSGQVQQSSQVDPRFQMVRVRAQRLPIGRARRRGIGLLQRNPRA